MTTYKPYTLCIHVLYILSLTVTAFGAFRTDYRDTIEIASLPYSMPYSDTAYSLSASVLTATGGGIETGGHDRILLTGRTTARDTIKFASSGTGSEVGLFVGYGSRNVLIRNLVIKSLAPNTEADSTKRFYCSRVRSSDSVWFDHCSFIAGGFNGVALWYEYGFNQDVSNCYLTSGVEAYRSRCNRDGTLIEYEAGNDYANGDFTFRLHGCKVEDAQHAIVAIDGGSAKILIHDDTLQVDARNSAYVYPCYNTCFSSGDAFAIDLLGVGSGTRVYHNVITSGYAHEGGQGILIQKAVGTPSDSVLIYENSFNIHDGPNAAHPWGRCAAIYFRFTPGNVGTGSEYVAVRDNTFKATFDTDTATTAIGRQVEVGSLILSGGEGSNDADVFRHIDIDRNQFEAAAGTIDDALGYYATAIGWGANDSAFTPYVCEYISLKYDHLKAPKSPLMIANIRGMPGNNLLMIGDTLEATMASDSTVTFCQTGAYVSHSRGNKLRDCVFSGNATDTVHFSNQSDNDSLGLSVQFERTVTVPVVNGSGVPVDGANYWVWNAYHDTLATGMTSGSCIIQQPAIYKFKVKDLFPTDSYVLSDSLGYNPISVKAKKGNDSTTVTINLSKTVNSATLTLSNTAVTTGSLLMIRK